jgi:hypothetical protein
MRNAPVVAATPLMALIVPSRASAWGFDAHEYIMRRAIELRPGELQPFCERYRDESVVRVTDPDLRRNVGWEQHPNRRFAAPPRELGAAIDAARPVEKVKKTPSVTAANARSHASV